MRRRLRLVGVPCFAHWRGRIHRRVLRVAHRGAHDVIHGRAAALGVVHSTTHAAVAACVDRRLSRVDRLHLVLVDDHGLAVGVQLDAARSVSGALDDAHVALPGSTHNTRRLAHPRIRRAPASASACATTTSSPATAHAAHAALQTRVRSSLRAK
eukprot:Mycagemm_TRINITY_DN9685_c0_g3::TRINITY_DN9685_c0_g3_i1::g.2563::m.2563 type:complete len:155 gc:universal TRINITY_DN9685_c0_g3_i1:82-546(+)